jgi:ribosomal protein L11
VLRQFLKVYESRDVQSQVYAISMSQIMAKKLKLARQEQSKEKARLPDVSVHLIVLIVRL